MPRSSRSRYQSYRVWEEGRPGLTHNAGSWRDLYTPRPITSIAFAALGRRNLELRCRQCPHVRVLHCAALVFVFERQGWDDRLHALPDRFYCSRCREAAGEKVRRPRCAFVDAEPTGELLAMPDQREWERFTGRYRSQMADIEALRLDAEASTSRMD